MVVCGDCTADHSYCLQTHRSQTVQCAQCVGITSHIVSVDCLVTLVQLGPGPPPSETPLIRPQGHLPGASQGPALSLECAECQYPSLLNHPLMAEVLSLPGTWCLLGKTGLIKKYLPAKVITKIKYMSCVLNDAWPATRTHVIIFKFFKLYKVTAIVFTSKKMGDPCVSRFLLLSTTKALDIICETILRRH